MLPWLLVRCAARLLSEFGLSRWDELICILCGVDLSEDGMLCVDVNEEDGDAEVCGDEWSSGGVSITRRDGKSSSSYS